VLQAALTGTATSSSHVEECPDIGPACRTAPLLQPPPYNHVQRLYAADLTLDAAYGVTPWLGLELVAPIRQVTTTIRYTDLAGHPYTPDPPDVHHRNETLIGPADPWLLAQLGGIRGAWAVSGRVGATVPIGRTEPNPFTLGEMGLAHEHIQFGSGTVDPLLGAAVERRFAGWSLAATALARLTLYRNDHGYQAGPRVFSSLMATSPLGTRVWAFTAGADLFHEWAERWDGVVREEGNIGRTDVLASAGASLRLGAGWTMTATAKVPVYVAATGAQVSYPAILQLGVGTSLGGR
jgi:hypothetical protein